MEQNAQGGTSARQWEPMRLSYVSSVGELMRNAIGSRLDNSSAGSCTSSNRRIGGTGNPC